MRSLENTDDALNKLFNDFENNYAIEGSSLKDKLVAIKNAEKIDDLKRFLRFFIKKFPHLAHKAGRYGSKVIINIGVYGVSGKRMLPAIHVKFDNDQLFASAASYNSNPTIEDSEIEGGELSEAIRTRAKLLNKKAADSPNSAVFIPKNDPNPPSENARKQTTKKFNSTPSTKDDTIIMSSKNIILYGPPGTGKTFATTVAAVCCAKGESLKVEDLQKRPSENTIQEYNRLIASRNIRVVTFHQSFNYEDFVEGLSARTKLGSIEYYQKPGVFKKIAAAALNEWLGVQTERLSDENDPEPLSKVFERAHDAVFNTPAKSQGEKQAKPTPYVLIIDEINRGNVAKIFGELITLIEDSKRARRPGERDASHQPTGVTLPLSGDLFYVPPNLHIIGTMNTADRSLVGMDMAMRRRFEFIELPPNPTLLDNITLNSSGWKLNLGTFLRSLNDKICMHDISDHQIGHAYLLNVKDVEPFFSVMKNSVIPQLRENMIGREHVLRSMLSRDPDNQSTRLFDERGYPIFSNLKNLSNYITATPIGKS